MNGVACNLESRGFKALCKATEEIVGHVEPYSITGSLPLIRELQVWKSLMYRFTFLALSPWTKAKAILKLLQDEGFDVQTAGYGECLSKQTMFKDFCWSCGQWNQSISNIKLWIPVVMNIFVPPASNWNGMYMPVLYVATIFLQAYWRRITPRTSTACFQTWPKAFRYLRASFRSWKKRSEPSCVDIEESAFNWNYSCCSVNLWELSSPWHGHLIIRW